VPNSDTEQWTASPYPTTLTTTPLQCGEVSLVTDGEAVLVVLHTNPHSTTGIVGGQSYFVELRRDGVVVARRAVRPPGVWSRPQAQIDWLDVPAAGAHVYTAWLYRFDVRPSDGVAVYRARLTAMSLAHGSVVIPTTRHVIPEVDPPQPMIMNTWTEVLSITAILALECPVLLVVAGEILSAGAVVSQSCTWRLLRDGVEILRRKNTGGTVTTGNAYHTIATMHLDPLVGAGEHTWAVEAQQEQSGTDPTTVFWLQRDRQLAAIELRSGSTPLGAASGVIDYGEADSAADDAAPWVPFVVATLAGSSSLVLRYVAASVYGANTSSRVEWCPIVVDGGAPYTSIETVTEAFAGTTIWPSSSGYFDGAAVVDPYCAMVGWRHNVYAGYATATREALVVDWVSR
jgi:hypothetical protein